MERIIPIVSNEWYHVFNRGNDRRSLFHRAPDYRAFLRKMEESARKYKIDRIVYALMPNHFHAILVQKPDGSLSRMMNSLATSYAKRFNLKYSHTGHVFEGRFQYCHIPSREALLNVARYIHMNPVRARLVAQPEEWEFSDFRHFLARAGEGVLHRREADEGHLQHGLPVHLAEYVAFVRQGVQNLETIQRYLFEPG